MPREGPSTGAVVRVVAVVVTAALLLYALWLVRQILVLVIVALFLAVGLDPAVRALMRLRLSRSRAVFAVLLGVIVFVLGFFASITPPLVRQTQNLAGQVPRYAAQLSESSGRFRELDERYQIRDKLRSTVSDLPKLASRSVGGVLGVARSIGKAVFSLMTVLILTTYFLLDLPKLIEGSAKLVPRSRRKRFEQLSKPVFERISGYILGNIGVSIVAGVTSFVALTALRVPYALPLAMWVAIADLIPMIGATLGAVVAVIVAFFHGVWTGVGTLIYFAVYQQVENYLVAPRVMRRAVDISPAAVILAALVGATLLGFVGALLAIPAAASIKVLAQEIWIPRQDAA
jgi:predicted PurR-regulated permease PerM